jgi:hypothetical protein
MLGDAAPSEICSRTVPLSLVHESEIPLSGHHDAVPNLNAVTPEDFGAAGDGVKNDKDAVQAAIDSGKSVYFANTYFLGSFGDRTREVTVLTITGKSNVRYSGPGTLKVTSSSTCVPRIIDVDDSHHLTIDLHFTDTGYDGSVTYRGAIAVNLVCAVGDVYGFTAIIRGTKLVAGFNTGNQHATTPAFRAYDLRLDCDLVNVYYGAQFRNCGDRVTGHVRTKMAHRSYFVYGAQDHDMVVMSDDHPLNYPQDVLIKTYDGRDTRNIKVKYSCTNFVSNTACVYIGNETTNGKTTTDIDVECNDVDSTNTNGFSIFVASTTAGVTDSATTKVITNLKLSGHCRFIPYVATRFQNTRYRNQLLIELEGDLAAELTSVRSIVDGWGGTPMAGLTSPSFLPRWKIGDKIHVIYTGLINSARVDVPIAPSRRQAVPIEMFLVDTPFRSSGYRHRQTTYVAAGSSSGGAPTVLSSVDDFDRTEGRSGTITQGVAHADADAVAAIRFTFSGWQPAPNGNGGYLRFVYPDEPKDENSH